MQLQVAREPSSSLCHTAFYLLPPPVPSSVVLPATLLRPSSTAPSLVVKHPMLILDPALVLAPPRRPPLATMSFDCSDLPPTIMPSPFLPPPLLGFLSRPACLTQPASYKPAGIIEERGHSQRARRLRCGRPPRRNPCLLLPLRHRRGLLPLPLC